MQEPMYDLIVVGAGPAGSMTAQAAARDEIKVLLVEKEIDIGVPVMCGEFIPSLSEMKRMTPNMSNLEELFNIPKRTVVNEPQLVRFSFPGGKTVEVEFEGLVLDRKLFDKHLAVEAVKAGAETMVSTRIVDLLKDGGVIAKSGGKTLKIWSRVVAAADGVYSPLARKAGLYSSADSMDYGVAVEYEMANVDVDETAVEMYFGRDYAPGAYAWIIPKGDGLANVGTGMRRPYNKSGKGIHHYLENFIKRHPTASKMLRKGQPVAFRAGLVPVGGPIKKTFAEGFIAVGDAAGQTMSAVGGGIPPALICGRIAGETVAEYVKGLCSLSKYEERWKAAVGPMLQNSLRFRKLGDIFLRSDKMAVLAAKMGLLNEGLLQRFVRCDFKQFIKMISKL